MCLQKGPPGAAEKRPIGPGPDPGVTDLGNPSPSPETNGWKNYMATYGMALTSEMAGTGEISICFLGEGEVAEEADWIIG